MATPANTSQQALCQLVPVYSTEQAECARIWINQMAKAAKWTGCTSIMLEFVPHTAAACKEILGPIRFKGLELYERMRDMEEGFVMWVPPIPPDRQAAPKRSVTVYEPPKPQPPPGATAYSTEGAEEIDPDGGEPDPNPPDQEPQPPPTPPIPANVREVRRQGRPRPLTHKGIALDPQQPPIDPEEDLSGGGKVTRVKPKKPKGS